MASEANKGSTADAKKRAVARTMSVRQLSEMYSKEFGKAGNVKPSYWVEKGLMPQAKMDALKADIAAKGVQTPLSLDTVKGKNVLLDGHHRLALAKELGIKRLPVTGLKTIGALGWLPALLQGGQAFTAKKPPQQMY